MQREFEKEGRERRKLHAQWRERERCCKSKSEHPTDFLSSQVQIRAHRASLPVKRGCERENRILSHARTLEIRRRSCFLEK